MEGVMTRIVREMGRKDGIRSYGPGKFSTLIDSYAYEMTLDGGPDEEATYPQEGSGWFGVVWLDESAREAIRSIGEQDGELTDEEEDLLETSKAVIVFERSDGIVEVDWFDSKKAAEEAWANVLVDIEGEEEDEDEEEYE